MRVFPRRCKKRGGAEGVGDVCLVELLHDVADGVAVLRERVLELVRDASEREQTQHVWNRQRPAFEERYDTSRLSPRRERRLIQKGTDMRLRERERERERERGRGELGGALSERRRVSTKRVWLSSNQNEYTCIFSSILAVSKNQPDSQEEEDEEEEKILGGGVPLTAGLARARASRKTTRAKEERFTPKPPRMLTPRVDRPVVMRATTMVTLSANTVQTSA